MMKMATSDGSLLRQGPGTGSRLVFSGYRGLRRRDSQSRFLSWGVCIYKNFWRRSHVRGGLRVVHEIGRAPRGVGCALHPRGWLEILLAQLFYSRGFFWSIKNHQKLARQLDSVWYSFFVKLKNKEKTETSTGL